MLRGRFAIAQFYVPAFQNAPMLCLRVRGVIAKIKEQKQEAEAAYTKMMKAYVMYDTIAKEMASLNAMLSTYTDYRANVAIPEAVRADFKAYFNASLASSVDNAPNRLSSDGATYSSIVS